MRFPGKALPITQLIGSALGSPAAPPPLPPIPEPAVAPVPDDKAFLARFKRKTSQRSATRGRLSTINTGPTVLG